MRKMIFVFAAVFATAALAVPVAFADSPHFISAGTASIDNSGAYVVTNFKEAGLGNTLTTEQITLHIDTATATYICVNGGSNHPNANNKQTVSGSLDVTQSFKVRNGQTTGTISAGPPAAGPFSPPCDPPMIVQLAFVSYSGVELIGLAGDTVAEPDLSRCFVTGKLAAALCP
jgi:hypothetical protein